MFSKLPAIIIQHFPAFKHQNYRLYFAGQLISFLGSWLQGIALGWLVYQLTHSPFWLGTVSAVSALPILILSLFAGSLVDRLSRKKVLIFTQFAALILALILGILTITELISLPYLIIIAFTSGIVNALDSPASASFVADIVGKDDLHSAIGLNSTMFNMGRVLGPAAAGFLIALFGMGNVFFINAASFLAILTSLYFIKVTPKIPTEKTETAFAAIKEGLTYSFAHPVISTLLFTAAVGGVFSFSQGTLMPVLAEQVFSKGAQGLGSLLSATGFGALVGSLIISSQFKKYRSSMFMILGNLMFLLSAFAFSFTSNIYVAFVLLFFSGLGLTLQFSSVYATIQNLVREEFRGRVSSIYILMFAGLSPLGNFLIGSAASWFGPQSAIRLFTIAVSLYSAYIYFSLSRIRHKYRKYQEKSRPAFT